MAVRIRAKMAQCEWLPADTATGVGRISDLVGDCLGRFESFVRPAPRAFFHPDRQSQQPPRAGPVKVGRVFAATRRAWPCMGPSKSSTYLTHSLLPTSFIPH